eukprot:scaffold12190_cov120-Isochrysis_galbana.AAC.1
MTIRPELTVTPYQATSRHRSASVSAASVGREFCFCPRARVEAQSTSYPTSLLPAAAGVRSTAPPAGKEGPGSGSEWKNGAKCPVINFSSWIHWLTKAVGTSFKELILPPYHRATSVLQRSICTTRPGSSIRRGLTLNIE